MIQRIQTVYLLIAAILMSLTLFLPPFALAGGAFKLPAVVTELAIIIPLIAIFLYRRRRLQIKFCIAELVLLSGWIALAAIDLYDSGSSLGTIIHRQGLSLLAVILSLLAMILAICAIVRDERLVKSLNRLR